MSRAKTLGERMQRGKHRPRETPVISVDGAGESMICPPHDPPPPEAIMTDYIPPGVSVTRGENGKIRVRGARPVCERELGHVYGSLVARVPDTRFEALTVRDTGVLTDPVCWIVPEGRWIEEKDMQLSPCVAPAQWALEELEDGRTLLYKRYSRNTFIGYHPRERRLVTITLFCVDRKAYVRNEDRTLLYYSDVEWATNIEFIGTPRFHEIEIRGPVHFNIFLGGVKVDSVREEGGAIFANFGAQ